MQVCIILVCTLYSIKYGNVYGFNSFCNLILPLVFWEFPKPVLWCFKLLTSPKSVVFDIRITLFQFSWPRRTFQLDCPEPEWERKEKSFRHWRPLSQADDRMTNHWQPFKMMYDLFVASFKSYYSTHETVRGAKLTIRYATFGTKLAWAFVLAKLIQASIIFAVEAIAEVRTEPVLRSSWSYLSLIRVELIWFHHT